jgi:hypothetical protein
VLSAWCLAGWRLAAGGWRLAPAHELRPVVGVQMVFHEYGKAKQLESSYLWRKSLAWRAFQSLVTAGLLQFAASK